MKWPTGPFSDVLASLEMTLSQTKTLNHTYFYQMVIAWISYIHQIKGWDKIKNITFVCRTWDSSKCEKENRNGGNLARSLHYGPEEGRGGGGKFRSSGGQSCNFLVPTQLRKYCETSDIQKQHQSSSAGQICNLLVPTTPLKVSKRRLKHALISVYKKLILVWNWNISEFGKIGR